VVVVAVNDVADLIPTGVVDRERADADVVVVPPRELL
jgi:hypothetical protein